MAKPRGKAGTFPTLLIFLLTLGVLVLSSLYFELHQKNALLLLEVDRLKQSQVLLMVPDDQAQAVANWMAQHPEATQTLLSKAKPGQQVTLEVGPGVNSEDVGLGVNSELEAAIDISPLMPQAETVAGDLTTERQISDKNIASHQITQQEQNGKTISSTVNELSLLEDNEASLKINAVLAKEATLSENEDGVKVISLPHGGIRVTTRENNQ